MIIILVPWAVYVNLHPRFAVSDANAGKVSLSDGSSSSGNSRVSKSFGKTDAGAEKSQIEEKQIINSFTSKSSSQMRVAPQVARPAGDALENKKIKVETESEIEKVMDKKSKEVKAATLSVAAAAPKKKILTAIEKEAEMAATIRVTAGLSQVLQDMSVSGVNMNMPVMGPIPTDGVVPLFDVKHQGGDAVFALATGYPKNFYQRFVGTLRKTGYNGDIVLAVSPPKKMKPGVQAYIS